MPANVHHLEGGTIEGDRSDVRITQLHATKVDSSQSRSSRSRAFDRRPLNLVALRDETRPAVVSVLPRQGTVSYFGCCCSVFGLAASSARLAIHASYSGVPRRGGLPEGHLSRAV